MEMSNFSFDTYDRVTSLDGINEEIELPTSSFLGSIASSDPLTISCWIYPVSPSLGVIVSRWDQATPKGWFFTALNYNAVSQYSGALRWQYRPHISAYLDCYSVGSVIFNAWNHVVVTLDGSRTRAGTTFYINGVDAGMETLGNNNANTASITAARPITVGSNPDPGWYTEGNIAELAVFSRELTSTEVLDIYNRGKENPNYDDISDLENHWMFSELNPVDKVAFINGSNNNMDSTNIIEE